METIVTREIELRYGVGVETELPPEAVTAPAQVAAIARQLIGDDVRENMLAFYLRTSNVIDGYRVVSRGTRAASLVDPQTVFAPAIVMGAAAVILAHNHPSGRLEWSDADSTVTGRIARAGNVLGIQVLDHVLIAAGNRSYRSMQSDPMHNHNFALPTGREF